MIEFLENVQLEMSNLPSPCRTPRERDWRETSVVGVERRPLYEAWATMYKAVVKDSIASKGIPNQGFLINEYPLKTKSINSGYYSNNSVIISNNSG